MKTSELISKGLIGNIKTASQLGIGRKWMGGQNAELRRLRRKHRRDINANNKKEKKYE